MDTVTQDLNLFLLAASGCKHHHMTDGDREDWEPLIRCKILEKEAGKQKAKWETAQIQSTFPVHKENAFKTEEEIHSCKLQSSLKMVTVIALYDNGPISFLFFCCEGCLLLFHIFHFNCQSVVRKQEGWPACAADPTVAAQRGSLLESWACLLL